MFRRLAVAFASVMIIFAFGVSDASAWCNGPYASGVKGNGYGTHDWILDQALRIARRTDPKAGWWLDRRTALLATDDPDTYHFNRDWGLFREVGTSRGAPSKIASLYYSVALNLKAGKKQQASKEFGWLTHFAGDDVQPFHLTWAGIFQRALHDDPKIGYEEAVDHITHHPTDMRDWAVAVPPKPLKDVRQRWVDAAVYSRAYYTPLIKSYGKVHKVTKSGNYTVYKITRAVLSRAANDLADLILAMPKQDKGFAQAPTRVLASVSSAYPAQNGKICAYATCLDAKGNRMEGVAVTCAWPTASGGVKKTTIYTNPSGVAHLWASIGDVRLMSRQTIKMTVSSSGTSTVGSAWFMATPQLAGGLAGIKTTVSDKSPDLGSPVTISTACHDTNYRVVAGLPVKFVVDFSNGPKTLWGVTNSFGVATVTIGTSDASSGEYVDVAGQTVSGNIHRESPSWFVPQ